MIKKSEAVAALPHLIYEWREANDLRAPDGQTHFSYSGFRSWADSKGYSRYFNFRSVASAEYDMEMLFDRHLRQSWRN